jgi:hypothetical protein
VVDIRFDFGWLAGPASLDPSTLRRLDVNEWRVHAEFGGVEKTGHERDLLPARWRF